MRKFALLISLLLALLWPACAQEAAIPTPPPPDTATAAPPAEITTPPADVATPGPSLRPTVPGEPIIPTVPPPPPEEPVPPGRVRISSQRQYFNETLGIYQFYGNVTLQTADVLVRSGEASYDANVDIAVARGNVSIRLQDGTTYWGQTLEYNARTRAWRFIDWSVEYPPEFLGQPFLAPVFVSGRDVSGLPDYLRGGQSQITTCNLAHPHYQVVAREVEIYPGEKLIARDADIYVLGHRVLRVPYFFLSLRQRRSPIVPEVGQNDYEGYFARFLYQYVVDGRNYGGVRLDQTTKLGTGVGIDHFYTVPNGSGEAFVYGRQGLNETVFRLDHRQNLPEDVVLDWHSDIRRDSLFTFQPTTLTNITSRLTRATTHSNTLLNFTRRLNEGQFSTDNASMNLRYVQRAGNDNFTYSGEFSSFGTSTGDTADRTLWNRVQWARRMQYGTLNLRLDQRNDLDDFAQQFSGVERLPEIYLETSQENLRWNWLQRIPSQFTVGWGSFEEQPTAAAFNRYLFNWQATPRPFTIGRTTITANSSYRQTVYGDQDTTALYTVNGGITARTALGGLSNVVRYGRQDSHGFTPFRFDFTYPFETVSDSLQYVREFSPETRVASYVTAGRDLENSRWQDLTFRSDVMLARRFTARNSFSYDLNNGNWRDLVSQFTWENNPIFSTEVGTRYDLEEGRLRRVTARTEWVLSPVWRVQWIGSYDGIRKQFIYNEYLITRDLHCWDASFYYSYQQKYGYLYLRLKALDIPLPRFGIGRAGQVLDTSQGLPY